MDEINALKGRIKSMLVENLMLQVAAAEIADDQPLFGPAASDSIPWTRSNWWSRSTRISA